MSDGAFALAAAAVAVVCCLGASLLAAAGGTAALSLAGVVLPVAALLGAAGWAGWHLARQRRTHSVDRAQLRAPRMGDKE